MKRKVLDWLDEAYEESHKGNCAFEISMFKSLAKDYGYTYRELDTSYEELRKLERSGYRREAALEFQDVKNKMLHGLQVRWYDFSHIEKLLRLGKASFKAIGTTKEEFYKLKQENDRRFGKG